MSRDARASLCDLLMERPEFQRLINRRVAEFPSDDAQRIEVLERLWPEWTFQYVVISLAREVAPTKEPA